MAARAAWALVAALAACGLEGGAAEDGPRALRCAKPCCGDSCAINCSWDDPGAAAGPPATLFFCPDKAGQKCRAFQAGHSTSVSVSQHQIYVRVNSTVWVERRAADGRRRLRSQNQTLQAQVAVQFPRLEASDVGLSRAHGSLTLTWPEAPHCQQLREKEVRIRPHTGGDWAQGKCHPGRNDGTGERAEVECRLEGDVAYEAQVRHRLAHWSSHWSHWSRATQVPLALSRSPRVNVTAGRLREDGTRNVTLQWESPGPGYGDVRFHLRVALLPCSDCQGWETREEEVGGRTSHEVALSGAPYHVSLTATNRVGSAPESARLLPPAQEAGPGALNISLSGPRFTARWRAPADAGAFCFESQALGEPPEETPCPDDGVEAGRVYQSSGTAEPNRCYRLAVHGVSFQSGLWTTFGLAHLFRRNASLEDPVRLNVTRATSTSATLRWEPPRPLSACPGALKKYLLCCRRDGPPGPITYYEAAASSTEFTLPDLEPQAAYLAGVWASTEGDDDDDDDGDGRGCRAHVLFATAPSPGSTSTALVLSFLSLGVFLTVLVAAGGFHLGKKRIQGSLWPPLPDPSGAEAVKVFPAGGPGQARRPWPFVQPSEPGGPSEPLLVEGPPSDKGPPRATEAPPEEPPPPKEEPPLPPSQEYKAQGLLGPGEEEEGGGEGGGGGGGAPEVG